MLDQRQDSSLNPLRYDCVYKGVRPFFLKAAMVVGVSRFFQRSVTVLSIAIGLALISGFVLGSFGFLGVRAGQQDRPYVQMGVYGDVLKKIQTDYVTEPNINAVTNGALHGLLESLDADSSYLSPAEYKLYKDRPTSGVAQLGMVVSKRYGYATVVSVIPGSPAAKEHLSDGDVIESIGDESTRELSLAVIRMLLEGKPGTQITLSVVRPPKPDPEKLTLTRAIVGLPGLMEQPYEGSNILYLKAGALTQARVDEIAAKLKGAGTNRKILLDLRDSSGGEAEQGLRLANFFIKQGTLGALEGQTVPRQSFNADPARFLTGAPLAVLVNRGTYGPAELAAAAIEDAKRGDLVGERTFGEGSVQKTIELAGGGALLLTVAKYQSPNGRKIQDDAVLPNVLVGPALDEVDEELPVTKVDEPLNKALELLKGKNS